MAQEEAQLELERNPSPRQEAKDFENPDERLQAASRAHELKLIEQKKGLVGKITGSTNESMNSGILVLFLCAVLLVASMLLEMVNSTAFSSVTDNLFKIILAVCGYIFGAKTTTKSE